MDFAKASKASSASLNWGSEVMDQGLLFGAPLRNLSAANRMALSEETLKNLPFFYGYIGYAFLGIQTVTVFQLLNWNCVFRASS